MPEPSEQSEGVRELFAAHADRYDTRHYSTRHRTYIGDRHALVQAVWRTLGLPARARVLDVACGPGRFLEMAAQGGADCAGIDASRDMLRTTKAKLGEAADLVQGDATALPFADASFDAVNCSGLIEYIPRPEGLLRELRRVLKPGGAALVASTNRLSPAHLLAPFVAFVRGSTLARGIIRMLRLPVDDVSLRQRRFRLTFHTPSHLTRLMQEAGFDQVSMRYCHLQLLPHPLDHVVPSATTACVAVTDRFLTSPPLRIFSEGLLAVGRRSP